jgi:hypothetical protein
MFDVPIMKTLKILGVPVARFGEAPDTKNTVRAGGLVKNIGGDSGQVPQTQGIFLSPRYEPSNITQNADVLRVQDAIRLAENGQTQELFRFYRDTLLSDDHIQACFNTRKLAVLSQTLNIMPADKTNKDDVALAVAMRRAKKDCENWNQGMIALMDSHAFWPVSIVERLYKPAGDPAPGEPRLQFTLRRFAPVNHQLECYLWAYLMGGVGLGTASAIQIANAGVEGRDARPPGERIDDWRGGSAGAPPANGRASRPVSETPGTASDQYTIDLERWEPYLKLWPIDRAGRIIYDTFNASYLDPARHVVHRGHLLTNFRDNWGGPARAILMWWLFRGLGREWFARGMDRYGSPWPVGYTDATDPVAVALLNQAFDLSKKLGGLVVDESSRVELKEAMVQGMAQGYETFFRLCNEAISYHITGLKESQKPHGLNAGENQMQQSVRDDVRLMDMVLLGETVQNQIATPFAQVNGLRGNVNFIWGGLNQDDAKKFADFLAQMKQAGYEASDESLPTINDKTGLVWQKAAPPADLGSTLGSTGAPPVPGRAPRPGTEPGENETNDKTIKTLSSADLFWLGSAGAPPVSGRAARPESPIEDIVQKHSTALATAFRGSLAPVRTIILNSTSRADAEKKLKLFFADWSGTRIAEIVDQAMQLCAAQAAQESGGGVPPPKK